MRLGLTYDLREEYLAQGYDEDETAEFDGLDTIQALERTLASLGYQTDRIGNVRDLTSRLARGDRWDLVFNIAEGLYGTCREAQVPALLDAFDVPYTFSDPLTLALTLHKAMAKQVVRDSGVPTPDFALIEVPADIDAVRLPFPLFAKPVAEGSSKGVTRASMIQSAGQLGTVCRSLLEKYRQPVLVERFLPGREFTVGIAGTGRDAVALGAMEIHLGERAEQGVYSRSNKKHWEGRVSYAAIGDELKHEAIDVGLRAWRALGCRDAGRVDVRCDAEGHVNFLEVNPLPGLDPIVSDLGLVCRLNGIAYQELIGMIVSLALDRAKAAAAHRSLTERSV